MPDRSCAAKTAGAQFLSRDNAADPGGHVFVMTCSVKLVVRLLAFRHPVVRGREPDFAQRKELRRVDLFGAAGMGSESVRFSGLQTLATSFWHLHHRR